MEDEEAICKKSWISSTNWAISNGSLDDSISFETPISSINEEHDDFHDSKSLKHQSLVLTPPPSSSEEEDPSPCEIKLSFEQRHEIRQVYVRSTARIFEIYYATGSQSSDEYLCTVRCGIAAKEDVSLTTSDTEEAIIGHIDGSTDQRELHEDKIKNDSNSNTDEDGWVEVKVPDSASLDRKTCSVAKNAERSTQDFYEATAEINDSIPCISLTLRLLSLNTKGCINLEEIYIFAEPVDPTDSDEKVDPMERSTQSSMMAMLFPTILQLSKTGMLKGTKDKHVSDVRQELKPRDEELLDPYIGRTMQEEAQSSLSNLKEVNVKATSKGSPESTRIQSDKLGPGTGQGPEFVNRVNDSSDRMERVLDQLVCRVGRIEAFCSRFEENMLKPISNIETRLERLEQQLEVLTMRSQTPELYPFTRITAPAFSSIESETNSHPNDEYENYRCGMSDFASKDTKFTRPVECFSNESGSSSPLNDRNDNHCCVEPGSFSNDDASSAVAPQLFPGLIITAPEFSNGDDDDDNDDDHCGGVGNVDDKDCYDDFASSEKGCPLNKPSLSLDDALAMALAGFVSSASAQPSQVNHSWIVKAPESLDENDAGNDSSTSPARSSCESNADPSSCFAELNGTQNSINLDSTSSGPSQDILAQVMRLPSDCRDFLEEEGTDGRYGDKSFNQTITGNRNGAEGEVNNFSMEDTTNGCATLKNSQDNKVQVMRLPSASSTEAVIKGCLLQEEGTDGSCDDKSVNQSATGNSDEMAGEVNSYRMEDTASGVANLEMDNNLNNSLNHEDVQNSLVGNPGDNREEMETMLDQNFNSTVDFELPVLDVKFMLHNYLNTSNYLETLLSDTSSETNVDDSRAKDNDGNVAVTGQSPVSLVDKDLKGSAGDYLLVEIENPDDVTRIPDIESKLQDPSEYDNVEMSSLI